MVQDDLVSFEQVVKEKIQLFGQKLSQRLFDDGSQGYQGSSIDCRCGGSIKLMQHHPKDMNTVFGGIKFKRAYYYCPDYRDNSVMARHRYMMLSRDAPRT